MAAQIEINAVELHNLFSDDYSRIVFFLHKPVDATMSCFGPHQHLNHPDKEKISQKVKNMSFQKSSYSQT